MKDKKPLIRTSLFCLWLALLLLLPHSLTLLIDYGLFSLLGVTGAIFANSTGAGGGVVFVPFFQQLEFSPQTSVATSFAIQCCGMTAGAITWFTFFKQKEARDGSWSALPHVLKITVPCSLLGIFAAQYLLSFDKVFSQYLHVGFGVFSILLGLAILITVPLMKKGGVRNALSSRDKIALVFIGVFGGAITAWLSIGVGELLAVYLIMRRFDVTFAIAVAVILSAFSVWGALIYHVFVSQAVFWPVVLFAGAGAIVGGILAKRLVLFFSATNLKIFFASWILILGIGALPI